MISLRKTFGIITFSLVAGLPQVVLAAPATYGEFVDLIIELLDLIVLALFGLLFVYFVWKIIDAWIINAGDQTKRQDGNNYAVAAVITFVVMVSVWGIVALIRNSLF